MVRGVQLRTILVKTKVCSSIRRWKAREYLGCFFRAFTIRWKEADEGVGGLIFPETNLLLVPIFSPFKPSENI